MKPQWKIHSKSLTVKKEKKNNSFPSLPLPYSFSKKEGIWGLNIGKSNSSWKEKAYLSNFHFIQVCFPRSLRGTQHFMACSSVFLLLKSIMKYKYSWKEQYEKDLGLNTGLHHLLVIWTLITFSSLCLSFHICKVDLRIINPI